jgi:hypothetical protein
MIGPGVGSVGRSKRQTANLARFQCPYAGIDDRISLSVGDPTHCIYTYNLVPSDQGMRVRNGFREWEIGIEDTPGISIGVRTIIPFDSVESGSSQDKLFVATNEGIWDVTDYAVAPTLTYTFTDQGVDAGHGNYVHYTGIGGQDLLFYADSVNGLFTYDSGTNLWSEAAGFSGVDTSIVNFIAVHKNRIWLLEQNSASGWYLDVDAITGPATQFNFGSKYISGGSAAGLFSWTLDGGAGIDDFLVSVSRSGDVLVYSGNDPSDVNNWRLAGSFSIGKVPKGTSFGSIQGSDLYLLSVYGLTSMGDLLKGVDSSVLYNSSSTTSPSARIANIIKAKLSATIDDYGWAVKVVPTENGLLISSPISPSVAPIQYLYRITTAAWGLWRGVPMTAFDTWNGRVVFGTEDSRVMFMDVFVDEFTITPPSGGFNGRSIEFSTLTNYLPIDSQGLNKRVKFIRPDFVAHQLPVVSVAARYDYDLREAFLVPSTDVQIGQVATWDVASWDDAIWGDVAGRAYSRVLGGWGFGRYVAIAMVGSSREQTAFVGWDLTYDIGGPMI